jgi:hypothetical protein
MTPRRGFPLTALALVLHAAAALVVVATPRQVGAHEFTLESLMTGFVKIEPGQAHFVVRVPLHVLKSARFPAKGREIDLAKDFGTFARKEDGHRAPVAEAWPARRGAGHNRYLAR